MGMYTEFIFQGETIKDVPNEVKPYLYYFFDEMGKEAPPCEPHPNHPFFECERKWQIGYLSSYYWTPFALRYMQLANTGNSHHVFLRCDLKNYGDEIHQFMEWIDPYMQDYYGWFWYEEDPYPSIFKKGRPYDEFQRQNILRVSDLCR